MVLERLKSKFKSVLYNQMIDELERNGLSYTDFLLLDLNKREMLWKFWLTGAMFSFFIAFSTSLNITIIIILIKTPIIPTQAKIMLIIGVGFVTIMLNSVLAYYTTVFDLYFNKFKTTVTQSYALR